MTDFLALLRFVHLLPVVFMAAPLYMLLIVNERGGFGPTIRYEMDRYMENIIMRQPKRCYIFLLTVLASGLALLLWGALGIAALATNWVVATKLVLFLILAGLLSYVHLGIQPKIEAIMAKINPQEGPSQEQQASIWALRRKRKKLASFCLFLVIVTITLGTKLAFPFNFWILILLVALAVLFVLRVYRSLLPYGWA